jgi:copper transport protein
MVHVLVIAGTAQEYILTAARVGAGSSTIGDAVASAAGTQAGSLALLTLAMTAGSAIGWRVREARVAVPLMLAAGLAAQALRGHPGVSGQLWQQSAVVIHVVVAALWVGLLAHLVGMIWLGSATSEEISYAVRRYATLALASAALVVATGIVLALGEIRQPQQLLGTTYGRILLLKAAVVLLALLAAAWARGFRISPPRTAPLAGLRALTRVEIGLLIGVVGIASLLGSVAPPAPLTSLATAQPLTEAPIPNGPSLTMAGQAGWIEVYLTASAGTIVVNVVTSTGSEGAATVRLRRLVVHAPGGQTVAVTARSCGPGCFRAGYDWPVGTTAIEITADASGSPGGTLQLAVPWPPVRSDPALMPRVVATLRAQPSILFDERVTSGPGATAESQSKVTGEQLLQSFPYGAGDAYALPAIGALRELVAYLPGSQIWMHLWIDQQDRLVRDVMVAPQHLLEHTFSYP